MGQTVTKLFSLASREVKLYNIERRAEKIISKEKPTPAPLHQSSKKELELLNKENVSKEYLQKKNNQLDDYLKEVYVTTPGPTPPPLKRIVNPDRPLPESRHTSHELSFGYSESEERAVPIGKVSLKQALQLIADHESDPETHSSAVIATHYKLPPNATNQILQNFKMFSVQLNKKDKLNKEQLTAYENLEFKLKSMTLRTAAEITDELEAVLKSKNETKAVEQTKDYIDKGNTKESTEKSNTNTSKSSNKKSKQNSR